MRKEDKEQKIKEIDTTIETLISNLNDVVVTELQAVMKEKPDLNESEVRDEVVNRLKKREDDNILLESVASLVSQRDQLIGIKKEKTIDDIIKNLTPTLLSILSTIFLFTILVLLFTGTVHEGLRDILNIFIGSALSIVAGSFSFWFGHKKDNPNDRQRRT